MTELRKERVQELGESSYLALKQTLSGLATLKKEVHDLHRSCLEHGSTLEYDKVQAIALIVDDMHAELERYLLPECDPDSADDGAIAEVVER